MVREMCYKRLLGQVQLVTGQLLPQLWKRSQQEEEETKKRPRASCGGYTYRGVSLVVTFPTFVLFCKHHPLIAPL